MSEACQEIVSLQNSLSWILTKSFLPMSLCGKNMTAIASSQVSCTNKLRHMTKDKENCVRECVTRNPVKTSWIASNN